MILDGLDGSTRAILLASRVIYSCIPRKRGLCMSSHFVEAKRNRDRLPAAIFFVYKQCVRVRRVIIVGHYSSRAIVILLPWNTRFYFGQQKPYMNHNKVYSITMFYILICCVLTKIEMERSRLNVNKFKICFNTKSALTKIFNYAG